MINIFRWNKFNIKIILKNILLLFKRRIKTLYTIIRFQLFKRLLLN